MNRLLPAYLVALLLAPTMGIGQVEYGANSESGSYAQINGIKLYYESYGNGDPILIIHGNGGDISSMSNQIEHFRNEFRVIAADSRGHGRSDSGEAQLTYRQIASDLAALVNHLSLEKVHIIGWSDGGIIGLILGIEFPELVGKMALMAPNTRPDQGAVDDALIEIARARLAHIDEMLANGDESEDWERAKQQMSMILTQPDITEQELESIEAPTLIIAGDRDFISNFHTVEIFESLQNGHLAILPNETHFTPVTNPDLFNSLVEKFIKSEFQRADSMEVARQREL